MLREDVVKLLAGLCGEPDQELVQTAGLVHQHRVEEGLGQRDLGRLLPLIVDLFKQTETGWDF